MGRRVAVGPPVGACKGPLNLLLLTDADRVGRDETVYTVRDHRHAHLRDVLRAEPGRTLRVGRLAGPVGTATVLTTGPDATELQVTWTGPADPGPAIHLVLAIPRPKSLKKLLPQIVALGVTRLTLLRSWRVAQPYLSSPLLSPAGHRDLVLEGLMQAGATQPPAIEVVTRFRPFVEDRLAAAEAQHRWVLHPGGASLAGARPGGAPVIAAIGPEGGWLPYEVEAFESAGFRRTGLGPRILRVETACVAVLAQLSLLRQL